MESILLGYHGDGNYIVVVTTGLCSSMKTSSEDVLLTTEGYNKCYDQSSYVCLLLCASNLYLNIIISLLISPLLEHRPSLWITPKKNES
jgi:hypothetical protein